MAGIWEIMCAFLTRLVGRDDSIKSRLINLETIEKDFTAAKRNNEDRLQSLQMKMKTFEDDAREKNKKLKEISEGSAVRIAIVGEIELIYQNQDLLKDQLNIIIDNLRRIHIALGKIAEIKAGLLSGGSVEQFDGIALDVNGSHDRLQDLNLAAKDLEKEKYKKQVESKIDENKLNAEVQETEKPPVELSPEVQKWLEQLEIA